MKRANYNLFSSFVSSGVAAAGLFIFSGAAATSTADASAITHLLRGGGEQTHRQLPHFRTFDDRSFTYVQDYRASLTHLEIKGAGDQGISIHNVEDSSDRSMTFTCRGCLEEVNILSRIDHAYMVDNGGDEFSVMLGITAEGNNGEKHFVLHARKIMGQEQMPAVGDPMGNPTVAQIWEDAYLSHLTNPDGSQDTYTSGVYRWGHHLLLAEPDHEFIVDESFCGEASGKQFVNLSECDSQDSIEGDVLLANYPLPTFHYAVHYSGATVAFAEVSGFTEEDQHELHDVTFTLKRGTVSSSTEFYGWINSVSSNEVDKQDITIELVDEAEAGHTTAVSWEVTNAYPTKLTLPSFDANGYEVAIESLELKAEKVIVLIGGHPIVEAYGESNTGCVGCPDQNCVQEGDGCNNGRHEACCGGLTCKKYHFHEFQYHINPYRCEVA